MNIFGYMDSNNPNAENATNGGDVIFGSGALNTVPGMTLYDPETGCTEVCKIRRKRTSAILILTGVCGFTKRIFR